MAHKLAKISTSVKHMSWLKNEMKRSFRGLSQMAKALCVSPASLLKLSPLNDVRDQGTNVHTYFFKGAPSAKC